MFRRILSLFSFLARRGVSWVSCGTSLVFVLGLYVAALPLCAAAQTDFGAVSIGSDTTEAVTVTIPKSATLGSIAVVTQGAVNLDFTNAGGGTCAVGASYAANSNCTVNVTFAPKYAGARYGAAVLADGSGVVVGTAYLQGIGHGPQITFLPPYYLPGMPNGTGIAIGSGIVHPVGVAVDGSGNVYIADAGNGSAPGAVYKETLSNGAYSQTTIGSGFMAPLGVAVDGSGNVYVADGGQYFMVGGGPGAVYKETLSNGVYTQATINYGGTRPYGAAVDGGGALYITDNTNSQPQVFKETPSGDDYAGSALPPINPGGYTSLDSVFGVAVEGSGNVYITTSVTYYVPGLGIPPTTYGAVYEFTPSGGSYTQTLLFDKIGYPDTFAVDGTGNLYLAEVGNGPALYGPVPAGVYRYTPQSAGSFAEAIVGNGLFALPQGVMLDGSGNIYVSDAGNINRGGSVPAAVDKLDLASPTLSFYPTPKGWTHPIGLGGTEQPVTVSNLGNAPLTLSAFSYPTDFPGISLGTNPCTASTSLGTGESCTLGINFAPVQPLNGAPSLALSESVTITSNTLNNAATTSAITVTGTETPAVAMPPDISPVEGTYTAPLTVTIIDTTAGAAIYYTNDFTKPLSSWTLYTGAITLSTTQEIFAIAVASGYINSPVAMAIFNINPPPDFTVGVSPPSLSIASGRSGTTKISVTPQNGFSSAVSFSCSGLPSGASCSFSPATITPSGATATTTLTVSMSGAVGAVRRSTRPLFSGATLAVAVCCLGWIKRRRVQLLVAVGAFGVSLLTGCGGGSSSTPQPITSTVTVTATAGSLQHNATFSLQVQ